MTGGIIQLAAAREKQDKYFTQKPQMTYFKMVYRRYTKFSMENIKEEFYKPQKQSLELLEYDNRIMRITVPRHADMVNQIYLMLRIPNIYSYIVDSDPATQEFYNFNWIENLGFQMIDTISLYIGKKLIDSHTGEWLQVWNDLTKTFQEKKIINKMIGNVPELYDPASMTGTTPPTYPSHLGETNPPPSIQERELVIPLDFWFCKESGRSLPLIALQNNEVEIEIKFRPLSELYTIAETKTVLIFPVGTTVPISPLSQKTAIDVYNRGINDSPAKSPSGIFKMVVNNDKAFAAITWEDEIITWGDPAYGGERFQNGSWNDTTPIFNGSVKKIFANRRSFVAVYEDSGNKLGFNWGDPNYGGYGLTGGILKDSNSNNISIYVPGGTTNYSVYKTDRAFLLISFNNIYVFGDPLYGGGVLPLEVNNFVNNELSSIFAVRIIESAESFTLMGNPSGLSPISNFGYSWGHYSVNPNSTTPLVIRIGTTNVIDSNIQNDKNLFITRHDSGSNKGKIIYWGEKPSYISNLNFNTNDTLLDYSSILGLYQNDVSTLIQIESSPNNPEHIFHQYGYGQNLATWDGSSWDQTPINVEQKAGSNNNYPEYEVLKTREAFLIKTDQTVTPNIIYLWGNPLFGGSYAGKGTTTAGTIIQNKLDFGKPINKIISNDYAFAVLFTDGSVTAWGDSRYGGGSSFNLVKEKLSADITKHTISDIVATKTSFSALTVEGLILVWGELYSSTLINRCREGDLTVFSDYTKFTKIYSSPETFIYFHEGAKSVSKIIKPVSTNSITHITNYLKGRDKVEKWGMKPHLEINYIYLDKKERDILALKNHKLLMDTVYHRRFHLDKTGVKKFILHTKMYHPTKNLIFVPKRSDISERNDWSNYTNWLKQDLDPFFDTSISILDRENFNLYQRGIITNIQILCNNIDRLTDKKPESYFTNIQKYQHNYSDDRCEVPVYNFNLNIKNTKPNGSLNFSQLKNFAIKLETLPVFSEDCYYIVDLYAVQNNILTIANGIGGIKYANK